MDNTANTPSAEKLVELRAELREALYRLGLPSLAGFEAKISEDGSTAIVRRKRTGIQFGVYDFNRHKFVDQ